MSTCVVRPYLPVDEPEILALVRADPLPGHPPCSREALAQALEGVSPDDAERWAKLEKPVVCVAVDADNRVAGVIAYALRPSDRTGVVLWLHAGERPAVVQALLDHALGEPAGARRWEAFTLTTPLHHGFDGIPRRMRGRTHDALTAAGFTPTYMGRYLRRDLPVPENPPDDPPATVHRSQDPAGWLLLVESGGRRIAEATICDPVDSVGELFWISVDPSRRGAGIGRRLLRQALTELSRHGAREVVLVVDDDEQGGERDRSAAVGMYLGTGFEELDRIHTYHRETGG